MDLVLQFLSIFILGFIGGAIPGPILASTFTEVLRKGFIKSLRIIIYAAISEIVVATLIMFLLFSINVSQSVYYGISFLGSGVLIWLANQIWSIRKLDDRGQLFNFKKIFLLTIFNGPLWIVWTTICVPQAYLLSQKVIGGQLIFLSIFEIGWFSSTLSLTFLFSRFRPLLIKEQVVSRAFKFFALILLLFALRLIATSALYFLK